jgi:hypothetical protein
LCTPLETPGIRCQHPSCTKARRRGSHNSTGSAHSKFNSLQQWMGLDPSRSSVGVWCHTVKFERSSIYILSVKEALFSLVGFVHGRSPALSHVIKCPSLSLFLFGAVRSIRGERNTHTQPIYRQRTTCLFTPLAPKYARRAFSIMLKSTQWALLNNGSVLLGSLKLGESSSANRYLCFICCITKCCPGCENTYTGFTN